ncbi:MAG: PilC/PilY family type IV pilus protein [Myxococcota bacterium]
MASSMIMMLLFAQYPDAADHLRARDLIPQVGLILDRSCSMRSGTLSTECDWYAANHNGGSTSLNKSEQMKAALVGCTTAEDGVLDRWHERINFSIYEFGSGTRRNVEFDSDLTALEAGVMRVPTTGGTHMSRALRDHGKYFDDYFDTTNTEVCKPNYLVFLSDGNPNGGDATFDWECTPPAESRYVRRNEPWRGADYMWSNPDLLCDVPGDQKISTYALGFGAPGSFNPTNLQRIAEDGGGEYFYASDVQGLSRAFESIISALQARSALFFAPIAIESGSLFPDNYAYVTSFRPNQSGPWYGNVKKYCVLPRIKEGGVFDSSDDKCLLKSTDGIKLLTNPDAEDKWTGSTALAADAGGAGAIILDELGGPGAEPSADPWSIRNIVTYRPGTAAYVPLHPDEWTEDDAFANGCQRHRLINSLHGYGYAADCATGRPEEVAPWPVGDPVHANPVFLRYGKCDDDQGQPVEDTCYVAFTGNDGMLHIIDSADGEEEVALIPGELWRPNTVPNSLMADRFDQPGQAYSHRFYVDGRAQLVHVDKDSDFAIDPDEEAYLLFSLGRGGSAHYLLDVSRFDGDLSVQDNPIYPLAAENGTILSQLSDTISPPWVGRFRLDEKPELLAVFGTGHVPDLDFKEASSGSRTLRPTEQPGTVVEVPCDGPGNLSDQSRMGITGFCNAYHTPACSASVGDCYDGSGLPLDISTVPLFYADGHHSTRAMRLYFDVFSLEEGDVLQVEDSQGQIIGSYEGTALANSWTPWVYDESVSLRLVTDGVDREGEGFRIARVESLRGRHASRELPGEPEGEGPSPGFVLGLDHQPQVVAVRLDRWNGASAPQAFQAGAADEAIAVRFTADCGSAADPRCVDASSSPDLEHMICPISSEVSVFLDGAIGVGLYWGDECGQIWKAWSPDEGKAWRVRRLANFNNDRLGYGWDFRKFFTRVDLVESRCPGKEVVGVYFGTGDVQHPANLNLLDDSSLNDGRDIVGVIWDDGEVDALGVQDLVDATSVDEIDPREVYRQGKKGWMLRLEPYERMIRDPLVAEGVAFFKTFTPIPSSAACDSASGIDRVYAVDNCSAGAANDVNQDGTLDKEDRKKWEGETEGGAGLFVYTPKETGVIVSHGDLSREQEAELNIRRKRPGLFLWRELE